MYTNIVKNEITMNDNRFFSEPLKKKKSIQNGDTTNIVSASINIKIFDIFCGVISHLGIASILRLCLGSPQAEGQAHRYPASLGFHGQARRWRWMLRARSPT